MTEIEKKALALLNECAGTEVHGGWGTFDPNLTPCTRALCRAIEQHEAFKQEVSDAVELSIDRSGHDGLRAGHINEYLGRFIIPKPTVDPLAAALAECEGVTKPGPGYDHDAKVLREALAKRGLKIVEVER